MMDIRILIYLVLAGPSYASVHSFARKYLKQFGYDDSPFGRIDDRLFKVGLKRFQYFSGVIVTGKLDDVTKQKMIGPRCGRKDPDVSGEIFGEKGGFKVVKQGTIWKKKTLTWRYDDKYAAARTLTKEKIITALRKALGIWEQVTNIKYIEDNSNAVPDIWFKFLSGQHGDPYKFDGRGGVLAHAYFPGKNEPGFDGDVHFDNDETFSIENKGGDNRDMLWVATHELGHSLGLDHSHVQTAVMYPWYTGFTNNLQLDKDDINGITALYGVKTKNPGEPRPPPGPQPLPKYKRCPNAHITAVWYSSSYKRYFFITKDQMIYSVQEKGILDGPILVSNYFSKSVIGDPIDAVFKSAGKEFIFAGTSYYEYKDFNKRTGPHTAWDGTKGTRCRRSDGDMNADDSPLKIIFRTIAGRDSKMSAAMKWQGNGKVYFFANDLYWKYDDQKKMFACGYPKYIKSGWIGLPKTIDAAHSSDQGTFFTSGNLIYRFDDTTLRVKVGYPKDIRLEWLKCTPVANLNVVTPTVKALPKLQECKSDKIINKKKKKPKGKGPGGHNHGGPKRRGPRHGGPKRGGPRHGGPKRGGPKHGRPKHGGPKRGRPKHGGPKRKVPGSKQKKAKTIDNYDTDCVNTDASIDSFP